MAAHGKPRIRDHLMRVRYWSLCRSQSSTSTQGASQRTAHTKHAIEFYALIVGCTVYISDDTTRPHARFFGHCMGFCYPIGSGAGTHIYRGGQTTHMLQLWSMLSASDANGAIVHAHFCVTTEKLKQSRSPREQNVHNVYTPKLSG